MTDKLLVKYNFTVIIKVFWTYFLNKYHGNLNNALQYFNVAFKCKMWAGNTITRQDNWPVTQIQLM